jgi:hypothetical protein
MINKIALAFVSPHSDFWEAPSFNGGNVRMKKSNPCDGLEPGFCMVLSTAAEPEEKSP